MGVGCNVGIYGICPYNLEGVNLVEIGGASRTSHPTGV